MEMEPEMEMEMELACNETSLANLTRELSCEPVGLLVFHGVCLAALLAASLFGNFTALYLVWAYRELRQRTVLASLGLIVADVLVTSVWVLQAEASLINYGWPFGDIVCAVLSYFYVALLYVRWCEILVFTSDRFCQILFPFWYERWGNVLLIVSTTLAWLIPAIASLPVPITGFYNFYLTLTACSVNCRTDQDCSTGVIVAFGVFISIGGLVPTVMYTALYIYGWKKKVAMKKMLKMGTGEGIPRSNSSVYINRKKLVQEIRLLTTCFLVFLTTILTNIPLYTTSSLRSRAEVYNKIPVWTHFVATYIFLLGPVLDPIVIMRTKSFRKALTKTFLCRKGTLILSSSRGAISRGLRGVLDLGVVSSEAGEISKSVPTTSNSKEEVTTNGTNMNLSLPEDATTL